MYVRNLLTAGDYMLTVPAGLNITIQYDEQGRIQKLLLGLSPEGDALPEELMLAVLPAEVLPRTIMVKQGTTWVSGVLVRSGNFSTAPGQLPEDFIEELAAQFIEAPAEFHFYAALVQSTAVKFTPGLSSTRWLVNAGFDTLSNFVVPASVTDEQLSRMLDNVPTSSVPAGVLVLHGGEWQYISLEVQQDIVKSVSREYDSVGYLKGNIQFESGNSLIVDYNDIVTYNVQAKSLVRYTSGSIVAVVATDSKKREARSAKISCPCCGASLTVTADTQCSNPRCASRYYEAVCHFLNVLKLPTISRADYDSLFKQSVSFIDVLNAPMYVDTHLTVSLYQLLRAAVPLTVVRSDSALSAFCDACNNNLMSIEYHIQHLDRAISELDLDPAVMRSLNSLICDSVIVDDFVRLLHDPHLSITQVDTKFDGAPIFRNRHICITGTFDHGSLYEVGSILRSYAADITDNIQLADCLIVGDRNEGTRGDWINAARQRNIPVFTESAFFDKYEIDADLATM